MYDGRAGKNPRHLERGFDFSDSDFAALSSWPRFDMEEVPSDSAVAVGYTVNTYKPKQGGILHCRLTFCLLLCLVCKMRASPTREDAVFFVFQLVAVSACSWDTFFFFYRKKE